MMDMLFETPLQTDASMTMGLDPDLLFALQLQTPQPPLHPQPPLLTQQQQQQQQQAEEEEEREEQPLQQRE